MKVTKIESFFLLSSLVVASFYFLALPANALTPCTDQVPQVFPVSDVEASFGVKVAGMYKGPISGICVFQIGQVFGIFSGDVVLNAEVKDFSSIFSAKRNFDILTVKNWYGSAQSKTKLTIGDDSMLITTKDPNLIFPNFYLITIKNNIVLKLTLTTNYLSLNIPPILESLMNKAVNKLPTNAGGTGNPGSSQNPTPPALTNTGNNSVGTTTPAPPSLPPSQSGDCVATGNAPVITSVTPTSVSAGKALAFNPTVGRERYTDIYYALKIQGRCLDGASLNIEDNQALDGKLSATFSQIKTSSDGTSVSVSKMTISQFAKAGQNKIVLTNKYGKATSFPITITITGTQYFTRNFPNLEFFGSWPQVDQKVLKLAKDITFGLNLISKPSYSNLFIKPYIYEPNYWQSYAGQKMCKVLWSAGCASPASNIIYVEGLTGGQSTGSIILHESAHKLQFYLEGAYRPVPSARTVFDSEWSNILANVTTSTCSYIPIKQSMNVVSWQTGPSVPRCTFVEPYAAYKYPASFYEDVAMFVEDLVFNPLVFTKGDAQTGLYVNGYNLKKQILNKYNF